MKFFRVDLFAGFCLFFFLFGCAEKNANRPPLPALPEAPVLSADGGQVRFKVSVTENAEGVFRAALYRGGAEGKEVCVDILPAFAARDGFTASVSLLPGDNWIGVSVFTRNTGAESQRLWFYCYSPRPQAPALSPESPARTASTFSAAKPDGEKAASTPPSLHTGRFERLPSFGVNIAELSPENYKKVDVQAMQDMGMRRHYVVYLAGNNSYKAGDYEKAIEEYTESIALNAAYANAYVSRGNAYSRKKDYSRAIEDYSRALRIKCGYAEAYNYRGYAYSETGDFERAIADYTQALRYRAAYADAYHNRGDAYEEQKKYENAIADYTRVIELEPRSAAAYNRRGGVWYNKNEVERAIGDFTQAISLKPSCAVYYYNRGEVWYRKSDWDKALADLDQALRLEPGYAAAYRSRAAVWLKKGDREKAAADLAAADGKQG
jgi:tetratricopeptide (TPR) repeat protein